MSEHESDNSKIISMMLDNLEHYFPKEKYGSRVDLTSGTEEAIDHDVKNLWGSFLLYKNYDPLKLTDAITELNKHLVGVQVILEDGKWKNKIG